MSKQTANLINQAPSQSRHIQVTDEFRARILSGGLKPGDRFPSYSEARKLYGIHTNTMEKVYARLESEGLIVRKRGSGTFVAQPRQTTRKSTGIIGLSGEGFSFNGYSSYWAQIMGGVRDAAAQAGLQVLILDPKSHNGWEKADGVLVCDWDDPLAPRQRPPALPLVSLLEAIEGTASVVADDEAGAYAATERLIELGHRRIAHIHGHEGRVVRNRLDGYHRALQDAGIIPSRQWTRWLYGEYDIGDKFTIDACKHMKLWLQEDWSTLGCTAILCHNDEAALGVMQVLNEAGIRVPQDVSVVGFDGTEFCDLVSPRLSSVQLPLREIGAAGVQMLLKQIAADEVSEEHRVLPTQLRMRESTSAPSHDL